MIPVLIPVGAGAGTGTIQYIRGHRTRGSTCKDNTVAVVNSICRYCAQGLEISRETQVLGTAIFRVFKVNP